VKVRAAVLREMGLPAPYARSRPLELAQLELDPPGPGEPPPAGVLIRLIVQVFAPDWWSNSLWVKRSVACSRAAKSAWRRYSIGLSWSEDGSPL